jgi:hypothetical protein
MKQLWEFGYAVRALQARMKFGELSRAPIRFSKLEWRFEEAECHWIARQPDPWDVDLPADIRARHASLQALKDAIVVRGILFAALSQVERANLRVYRLSATEPSELIISGSVTRERDAVPRVASLAMRAKLLGFRFSMEDGVLEPLRVGDQHLQVAAYE